MVPTPPGLPYKLATLCDLRDEAGRVLLIRRKKSPNQGLCSPIGGKLDMESGESPAQCAAREIREEAGLDLPTSRLHLLGLISERSYEDSGHWLLFYFRVLGVAKVEPRELEEGWLEWHDPDALDGLPLPETDRRIFWPLVREHDTTGPTGVPGFFSVHVECAEGKLEWSIGQSIKPRE